MFGLFTSAETHVVRAQENADLKKRIKVLEEAAETREKAFAKREKALEERHEDAMHDLKRDHKREVERLEDEHEDEVRELNSDHRDEIEEKDRTIASLERDIEDDRTNVKLEVEKARLAMKEGHLDEVNSIFKKLIAAEAEVKVAVAEGKAKAAQSEAEASAYETLGETLAAEVEGGREMQSEILDVVKTIAPKVDLSKMEVNVNVPTSQGGNKGGEQKQK